MARRNVVVRSALRQGQRRKSLWLISTSRTAVTALGGATSVLDQSFSELSIAPIGPFTIVRVRGELYIQSDQTAVAERPFGALGMSVVSEQARAAGVASVPTPVTDQASDLFFLWIPWQAAAVVDSAAVAIQPMYRFEFDSKGMRKVAAFGNAIVVTIENSALAGIGAQYIIQFRILVKLH